MVGGGIKLSKFPFFVQTILKSMEWFEQAEKWSKKVHIFLVFIFEFFGNLIQTLASSSHIWEVLHSGKCAEIFSEDCDIHLLYILKVLQRQT